MNLGQFRQLTNHLPDNVELIFESLANPCGNCWDTFYIEVTSISFFGIQSPAVKLLSNPPHYIAEDDLVSPAIYVHPTHGQWSK